VLPVGGVPGTLGAVSGHAIPGWVVLTIKGTANECTQVLVTIRCGDQSLGPVVIPVVTGISFRTAM
jgi:hypothetical protein